MRNITVFLLTFLLTLGTCLIVFGFIISTALVIGHAYDEQTCQFRQVFGKNLLIIGNFCISSCVILVLILVIIRQRRKMGK